MMKSALILIDIQNDYFPGGSNELYQAEEAGARAQKVLDFYRRNKMPLFFIQHINDYPAAPFFRQDSKGAGIHPCVAPRGDESIIVKHAPSSFYKTVLLEELKKLDITHLVIVGMMSHMCVDTTVRAARDLDFTVTVLEDACTTCDMNWRNIVIPAKTLHTAFMGSLSQYFADVIGTEQYLSDTKI